MHKIVYFIIRRCVRASDTNTTLNSFGNIYYQTFFNGIAPPVVYMYTVYLSAVYVWSVVSAFLSVYILPYIFLNVRG